VIWFLIILMRYVILGFHLGHFGFFRRMSRDESCYVVCSGLCRGLGGHLLGLMRALAKAGDGIECMRCRRFFFDSDALDKLIGSAWYSSAKIERELGFKPVHDLPRTLPEIVLYLESN
jgi:hypothetical protein